MVSALQIDWLEIPSGEFIYGLSKQQASQLLNRLPKSIKPDRVPELRDTVEQETPDRLITLDTFYVSRFPVTNEQNFQFLESSHRYSPKNVLSGEKRQILVDNEKKGLKQREVIQPKRPGISHRHFVIGLGQDCRLLRNGRRPLVVVMEDFILGEMNGILVVEISIHQIHRKQSPLIFIQMVKVPTA